MSIQNTETIEDVFKNLENAVLMAILYFSNRGDSASLQHLSELLERLHDDTKDTLFSLHIED